LFSEELSSSPLLAGEDNKKVYGLENDPSPNINFYMRKIAQGTNLLFNSHPIKVLKDPIGIAIDSRTNSIYTANFDSKTISFINGSTNEVKDIPLKGSPQAIAVRILKRWLKLFKKKSD